jgi:hypothetical protein
MKTIENIGVQPESAAPPPQTEDVNFSCQRKSFDYENYTFRAKYLGRFDEIKQWMMTKGPILTTMSIPWLWYYSGGPDDVWDFIDFSSGYGISMALICVGFDWAYISRATGLQGAWICQDPR